MNTNEINYEEYIRQARRQAVENAEIDWNKINKRCLDWGVEPNEHNYYLSQFAKDPMKQNINEKYFEIVFNTIKPKGITCYKLPAGGKDAIYPTANGARKEKPDKETKSLDFVFKKDNNILGYSTNKYTKEAGGAQDNQRNDVIHTLSYRCPSVFAICDGQYWTKYKSEIQFYTTQEFINSILNNKIFIEGD